MSTPHIIIMLIAMIVTWAIGAKQGYDVGYERGRADNGPG
jgi:hypothetical protein